MENNEINVQNNDVKKSAIKWILVVLIALVVILTGYVVYDNFIVKDASNTEKINYVGYYKGCAKDLEGDDVCSELVLNEDKTAFLLNDPLGPTAIVGNYSIDGNTLTINSTYKLSENTAVNGINNETYNLKVDGDSIIYNFNNGTIKLDFKLTKTTQDKLDMYIQMKAKDTKTTTNETTSQNNTQTTSETDEAIVKRLFINEYLLNPEAEKLLDYRIDKIEVYAGTEKDEIVKMGYQSTDILANVTYSVKVNDPKTSDWDAGNGEGYDGQWILRKNNFVAIRNGKLLSTGTSP